MQAVCRLKCFVRGRSIKPGEILDLTKAESKMDVFVSSFTIEPDALAAAIAKKPAPSADDELTVDELKRRLSEAGIPFKARDTKDELMAAWLKVAGANTQVGNKE